MKYEDPFSVIVVQENAVIISFLADPNQNLAG